MREWAMTRARMNGSREYRAQRRERAIIRPCPLCGQPQEIEIDGMHRGHACPALQDVLHEAIAHLRYLPSTESDDHFSANAPPEIDFKLDDLPPALRGRAAPILERMARGAIAPADWEALGQLLGEMSLDEDGSG
jgi:hypothetical protein